MLTGERAAKEMYHLNVRSQDVEDFANAALRQSSSSLWHQRLGHADSRNIRRMCTKNLVHGLQGMEKTPLEPCNCVYCARGKMHKLPFEKSKTPKATRVGGRVVSDTCGPMSFASLGGCRYMIILKDQFSGWTDVRFMKSKSEVLSHLQDMAAFLENQTGFSIEIFRTDNGTEYMNISTARWILQKGIRHETSCTYTPEQNGMAERANRTIMEMVRCMLYSSDAPLWLWAEAAKYAAYIRNRIPSTQELMTPFEKMYQRKPDVSNIRIFGSATSVLVPDTQRTKLQSKSMEGFLVGVGETQKGYRIYVPALGKVVTSRNVIIDESRVGFKGDMTNKVASTYMPSIYDPFVEQFDPCNLTTGPAHVANQQHGAVAEQGAAAAHPLVVEVITNQYLSYFYTNY